MKHCLLAALFLVHMLPLRSQNPATRPDPIKFRCRTTRVSLPPAEKDAAYPSLFDSLLVLDYRRDTSRIGLVGFDRRNQWDINFKSPANSQLQTWLKKKYARPDGKNKLLITIRDLWISNYIYPEDKDSDLPPSSKRKPILLRYKYDLHLRLDAWLATPAGHIPLVRLDTLIPAAANLVSKIAEDRLPELISIFMDQAAQTITTRDISGRRKLTMAQIDSFCLARYNFPMDTAKTLVKGVYTSLEEFRNNQPSILKYELTKNKASGGELRIPDNAGNFIYTHTAWGFCDGEYAYVMMDGNLFPAFSIHHQFYVLGSKEYQTDRLWIPFFSPLGPSAAMGGVTAVKEEVSRKLRFYRLNTENGAVTE